MQSSSEHCLASKPILRNEKKEAISSLLFLVIDPWFCQGLVGIIIRDRIITLLAKGNTKDAAR
jgi:hypothetical protein